MSTRMNFVTGKHIPRRTFVQAMGATVALPFLDAMIPAGRSFRSESIDNTRLICMEEVHGSAGSNDWGATQHLFAPEKIGKNFEMNDLNLLKPLEPFQDYLTIISNTDVRMADAWDAAEIGGDHFRSSAVFLTQSHPRQTQGSDLFAGVSLDQIYARRAGKETAFPSLQLCIETSDLAGGCHYNYACAYRDSISWASETSPLPMVRDPRMVFEMLFGAGATEAQREARRNENRSILDWIAAEVGTLRRELGASDRLRVDQYLNDVRELERRLQMVEAQNSSGEARELPEAPVGVPDSFEEHMKLMFDLQLLAFESDLTRVVSFKWGRDASNRIFPDSGVDRPIHPASHHGNDPARILEWNQIHQWRMSMMPYFLEKLQNTMEGDRHLLDKTLIVWGSPMGDGNVHNHRRCPLVLLGGANGRLEGNLHLKAPDNTPMANAMLTVLHTLGMDDMPSFGDSTAAFPLSRPSAGIVANDRKF
jgi:hypothetical protein